MSKKTFFSTKKSLFSRLLVFLYRFRPLITFRMVKNSYFAPNMTQIEQNGVKHVPSILFAGAHQDPPRGARAKPEYCICRGFDDGSKMIVFDGCDEWFQANCLDILEDYIATLESESLKWYCPGCSLNANSNYVA